MHHFYVAQGPEGGVIRLTDAERVHRLRDVLRLSAGEEVTVFDGIGHISVCIFESMDDREAVLRVKSTRTARPAPVRLAVACALPKADRMDDVVDKLTQLGVDAILPMQTERVVVRLDEAGRRARLERWQRIAVSAAEQSRRDTLPEVSPIADLDEVLARADAFDLKLVAALSTGAINLKDAVAGRHPKTVLALVGPEGDFTPDEVAAAVTARFVPVSLGSRVLRVETAAIALASYVMISLDE